MSASARAWILASRPRTLPAAVVPVLLGCAAARVEGAFDPVPAALCLAFALLVQVGANFANDADDFARGADTAARIGPTRAVAAGLISPRAMRNAATGTLALAFLVGLGLVPFGGWVLLGVGVACVAGALLYTGGPRPLGYLGLGDVLVFVFFGLVAVMVTTFVQTGGWGSLALALAVASGCWTTNLLVVNNHRDADTDVAAGKRTLAVRFGRGFVLAEFAVMHGLAIAAVVAAALLLGSPWPLLGLIPAPLAPLFVRALRRATGREAYGKVLATTAAHLLVSGVLLALGTWIAA